MRMIIPVRSYDLRRQSTGYQKSIMVEGICWKVGFEPGVKDDASVDDDEDGLTSEWRDKSRETGEANKMNLEADSKDEVVMLI